MGVVFSLPNNFFSFSWLYNCTFSHFPLMSCRECLYDVGSVFWWSYNPAADSCLTQVYWASDTGWRYGWRSVSSPVEKLLSTKFKCVCVCVFCLLFIPSFVCRFIPVHSLPRQEISELKEQIEDVEGRYMQGLKEMKVLVCVALILS